jgi:hypothetical protein
MMAEDITGVGAGGAGSDLPTPRAVGAIAQKQNGLRKSETTLRVEPHFDAIVYRHIIC